MSKSGWNSKLKSYASTTKLWHSSDPGEKDIAVMMSGGVDSSVTAALLLQDGWNVMGITMQIPMAGQCSHKRSCCGTEAAHICQRLGIAHYFVDVHEAFNRCVIEPFRRAYMEGRTPSPCIDCNTKLKFAIVWDYIREQFGVRRIATGHYARIVRSNDGSFHLMAAADRGKDQSYFLYGIPAERLAELMLPLGDTTKDKVRKIASDLGLSVARKPESMELCFAAEGDYRLALGEINELDGVIQDTEGNTLGRHKGISNYTIGQRKGLRVAAKMPLYVVETNAQTGVVTLGPREQCMKTDVSASDVNVLDPSQYHEDSVLLGKIRSQGKAEECQILQATPGELTIRFSQPQFAPAPGQRLVLYDNTQAVVAGGCIVG